MYPIIASNFLNLLREITEKLFSIGPKWTTRYIVLGKGHSKLPSLLSFEICLVSVEVISDPVVVVVVDVDVVS